MSGATIIDMDGDFTAGMVNNDIDRKFHPDVFMDKAINKKDAKLNVG